MGVSMRTRLGIVGGMVVLAMILVFVCATDEPPLPIYPDAQLLHTTPYQLADSGSSEEKVITFQSNADQRTLRHWYDEQLKGHWFQDHSGYVFPADMLYGSHPRDAGFSRYTLGISFLFLDTRTEVTLKIKRQR